MTTATATAPTEAPTAEDRATMAGQPYRGTKLHAMRIPDDVWTAALQRAGEDGSSISAEVVAFLRAYGTGDRFTLRARKPAQ